MESVRTEPAAIETPSLTLGQIAIDEKAFELDLKINEGYQSYSAELSRLALLIVSGVAAVWLKLYMPDKSTPQPPLLVGWMLMCAFISSVLAAAAAMIHRYTAADSLAYHLTALRRRSRNRPKSAHASSDQELAKQNDHERNMRFLWSARLLRISIAWLIAGLAFFCCALTSLTHLSR